MNAPDLAAPLHGCRAAHRQLVAHLEACRDAGALDDATVGRASRLPGWSVGHVLTHLARNADSHVRVIDAALAGECVPQYDGGLDGRAAAIEAGAGRTLAEQLEDVTASIAQLEAAWERAQAAGWPGSFVAATGEVPLTDVVFRRWREVEVHHADLGLDGFDADDWSGAYVEAELPGRVADWLRRHPDETDLPPAALGLPPSRRLAWLLGRVDPPGLEHVRFA